MNRKFLLHKRKDFAVEAEIIKTEMELLSFAQDALQTLAEYAASYRMGQIALKQFDRVLWVVEKCARWAVPPPLDQDERPQPELVRPLPWVFFLMMLITLRVTRETISIINLIIGKPPLRSADVVMYIQSKRRYLRTLKYQGNRIARARSSNSQPRQTWCSSFRSLFEFTMCFQKSSLQYGNNNSTNASNNDEVLVVKCGKPERKSSSPKASASVESTMERLIEKMMVDLDADSDEDSSFTITTITTPKSERSEVSVESDQDTGSSNETASPKSEQTCSTNEDESRADNSVNSCSTPEKKSLNAESNAADSPNSPNKEVERNSKEKDKKDSQKKNDIKTHEESSPKKSEIPVKDNKVTSTPEKNASGCDVFITCPEDNQFPNYTPISTPIKHTSEETKICVGEENALPWEKAPEIISAKQEALNFLQHERSQPKPSRAPKNDHKMANGRLVKSVPSKKKGGQTERRDMNSSKTSAGNSSF